jgi:hypothetical protein
MAGSAPDLSPIAQKAVKGNDGSCPVAWEPGENFLTERAT